MFFCLDLNSMSFSKHFDPHDQGDVLIVGWNVFKVKISLCALDMSLDIPVYHTPSLQLFLAPRWDKTFDLDIDKSD